MIQSRVRNTMLRKLLLDAYPQFKGRIWINKRCITVRGFCTTWFREPDLSVEDEAKHFVLLWDDHVRHSAK